MYDNKTLDNNFASTTQKGNTFRDLVCRVLNHVQFEKHGF